ncbi:MAG: hypothetical protein JXN65_07615 [Clostridia bacterium]|nr:hypothetical protein [Clostridia bacterium]
MNDREMEKLIKAIDTDTSPPEGLKKELINKVMSLENRAAPILTPIEKFLFEKPLRAACFISLPVTGAIWAIMGNSFAAMLSSLIV